MITTHSARRNTQPSRHTFGSGLGAGIGKGLVIVGLVVAVGFGAIFTASKFIGGLHNPVKTTTVVHDHSALLKSISDLAEFHASTGNFQVIVDLEHDVSYVPSAIAGDRTLLLAQGSVDGVISLSGFSQASVRINAASNHAEVLLPKPTLSAPHLDMSQSKIYEKSRGLVNRVGDMFGNGTGDDSALYKAAESKLTLAAQQTALLAVAERNMSTMIEQIFHAAGIAYVSVNFGDHFVNH